jgi:hypothetical protein
MRFSGVQQALPPLAPLLRRGFLSACARRWWRAGALNRYSAAIQRLPAGAGATYIPVAMRQKKKTELRALLRAAERKLDAARRRSEVNEAARNLMQAKAALKRLEQQPVGAS